MRSIALVVVLAASPALAGSKTGGDSGGGRLGGVSSGLDKATDDPPSRGSSSTTTRDHRDDSSSSTSSDDSSCYSCSSSGGSSYYDTEDTSGRVPWTMPKIDVSSDGFAGVQKVHESDGSLSLELSVVFNKRLRFTGAVTHYYEDQMDGGRITLTAPSFGIGVKIAEVPRARVWLDAGIVHVGTKDPAGSSSLAGAQFLGRLEHDLTNKVLLVGSAGAMLFEDVQAFTGRVGVRFNHVEAAFRYLEFSVGEALFGPEIGLAF